MKPARLSRLALERWRARFGDGHGRRVTLSRGGYGPKEELRARFARSAPQRVLSLEQCRFGGCEATNTPAAGSKFLSFYLRPVKSEAA
jgi:hypothetical protein